jgi:hypothetical protein
MKHDLYLRAHAVELDKSKRESANKINNAKWPDFALVFDCETRISSDQLLTFSNSLFPPVTFIGTYCSSETARETDTFSHTIAPAPPFEFEWIANPNRNRTALLHREYFQTSIQLCER